MSTLCGLSGEVEGESYGESYKELLLRCKTAEAELTAATQRIAELEQYERACKNHLCAYDLADWLACAGEHAGTCEACENLSPHPHRECGPAANQPMANGDNVEVPGVAVSAGSAIGPCGPQNSELAAVRQEGWDEDEVVE